MFYDINFDDDNMKIFQSTGLDLELILKTVGVPYRAAKDKKFQLSSSQYKALVLEMDQHIDEAFIVGISKVDGTSSFNPEFFAGLCAANGFECIKRISKFKKIIAPVVMAIEEDEHSLSISYHYHDGDSIPKMMLLHAQISILSILRKGTGHDMLPTKIISPYDYPKEALDYFGMQPITEQNNKIVFTKFDLKRPFITKNNRMWEYLEGELNQRLKELEVDQSFSASVRRTLLELLPSGVSDADKISHELGVSKRTLQRRLKNEQTTFNEQLNHTRELMVRNYLKMNMNLDEIAFLINYSDAKSLSRAFKTWTGKSVTDYRLELEMI